MPAIPMFFLASVVHGSLLIGGGGGLGGLGAVQEEIIYLPTGRVVHCYSFKLLTSLGLFLVLSALFFSFMKKKHPYLQTSIDQKNIEKLESKAPWRETKKQKISRSENVM